MPLESVVWLLTFFGICVGSEDTVRRNEDLKKQIELSRGNLIGTAENTKKRNAADLKRFVDRRKRSGLTYDEGSTYQI